MITPFTGYFSHSLMCTNPDDIVVGGCSSGRYADCASEYQELLDNFNENQRLMGSTRKASHVIKCCSSGLVTHNCRWKYGHYGEMVKCNYDEVVHGMCASGANKDCKASAGKAYTGV